METDFIIISEYCQKSHVEHSFIFSLEEGGLIEVQNINGEKCFPSSQLRELERYTHLYYDLSINIEGIDAINHLLDRMIRLQSEISRLHKELSIYEPRDNSQPEK